MSNIKFLIGDQADLSEATKVDGQFLISKNNNQLNAYVDYDDDGTVIRKQIGGREVELTQVQYNALSTAEKNNGTTYYITDGTNPGSGGGGHTIINATGVEMDQRSNLKFTGCAVTDDETNDTTIVAAPTKTSDLTNDSGFITQHQDLSAYATKTGNEALTNKTINGYTPGAAMAKSVTDSSSASAIGTGTDLPTERDIYYGLPTINGSHTYTSGTNIYAPTSAGTSGQVLVSNGSGAPGWGTAPSGLGTKVASTVSDDTVTFTNAAITNNSIIDGPYIADVLVGLVEAEQTGTTVTFTLTDDSADGKNAYIWVRE